MQYLGCFFSFASDAEMAKDKLLSDTKECLDLANSLPITPSLKCHALNLWLRARLSFLLRHYVLSPTWIKTNLDSLITDRVRRWMDLPPSATAHFFPLPNKLLGLDLVLPSMLAEACQMGTSMTLAHSSDPRMSKLLHLGGIKPCAPSFLALARREASTALRRGQRDKQLERLDGLQIQSTLMKALRAELPTKELEAWTRHIALLTPSITSFARKALLSCLPTNSNLARWGRNQSDSCPACNNLETQNHILNNCSVAAVQGRYSWRHNAVLRLVVAHILAHIPSSSILYADLPGCPNPSAIYNTIIPDITVVSNGSASILELTCCSEKKFKASKEYKLLKYHSPQRQSSLPMHFRTHTLEVSSLGFVNMVGLEAFCRDIGIPLPPSRGMRRWGEMALRCSYFIFCCRHDPWPLNMVEPYVQ
jgi:hypothetical protein